MAKATQSKKTKDLMVEVDVLFEQLDGIDNEITNHPTLGNNGEIHMTKDIYDRQATILNCIESKLEEMMED